jgi:hypothetical protein
MDLDSEGIVKDILSKPIPHINEVKKEVKANMLVAQQAYEKSLLDGNVSEDTEQGEARTG